jgi:hypothetical protein
MCVQFHPDRDRNAMPHQTPQDDDQANELNEHCFHPDAIIAECAIRTRLVELAKARVIAANVLAANLDRFGLMAASLALIDDAIGLLTAYQRRRFPKSPGTVDGQRVN